MKVPGVEVFVGELRPIPRRYASPPYDHVKLVPDSPGGSHFTKRFIGIIPHPCGRHGTITLAAKAPAISKLVEPYMVHGDVYGAPAWAVEIAAALWFDSEPFLGLGQETIRRVLAWAAEDPAERERTITAYRLLGADRALMLDVLREAITLPVDSIR